MPLSSLEENKMSFDDQERCNRHGWYDVIEGCGGCEAERTAKKREKEEKAEQKERGKKTCRKCHGSGEISVTVSTKGPYSTSEDRTCPKCGGSGEVDRWF